MHGSAEDRIEHEKLNQTLALAKGVSIFFFLVSRLQVPTYLPERVFLVFFFPDQEKKILRKLSQVAR